VTPTFLYVTKVEKRRMKNEFVLAFNEVIEDKQLPHDVILKALESAMVSAYRRALNASSAQLVEAQVDPESGKVLIMAEKEVVEVVQDTRTEVSLEEARQYNPEAEVGVMVIVDSTPTDFGRVAAQTARQVIQQRIRDAERQAQLEYYQKQLGEIISGIVQAVNSQGLTIGLEMRAEGTVTRKDMIPGERFRIHDRVRALVSEVKDTPRGPQILLSRTHRDFLRRLLENEVPEIYHGVVEIRSIAREPGERAKVAVSASQSGIDPVGACVGIRGVRIQAIVRELHDEKIDVIEWNSDPTIFIAKALSPARVSGVYLSEKPGGGKTATVVVYEDQLSLAIGRDGQNARLAAKLTGWRIDIKGLSEAVSDTIYKLNNDPAYASLIESESENASHIDQILVKKSEGRPLTPEEYDTMIRFVERIERQTSLKPEDLIPTEEDEEIKAIRAALPEEIFRENILDCALPEHVRFILQEAGYMNTGELIMKMKTNPDDILRIQSIGPKAMAEINKLLETFEPEVEVEQPEGETEIDEQEQTTETIGEGEQPIEEEETAGTEELTLETSAEETKSQPEDKEESGEEETSFEELFTLKTDVGDLSELIEEEGDPEAAAGKKAKKKRKHVQVEYDPDLDMTLVHKKRKRDSQSDWDWEG
jgi:transcription termination/antitermination protein NusA